MNKNLGYYIVDNKTFESKIHALLHATQLKKPVKWIFNNSQFENYNWVQEPIESLDELYGKRARQLREKYDYLILCYSGGSDSNNILESFIKQNLHIDEIVTNFIVGATKSISDKKPHSRLAENHNAEWDHLTKHRMQYIREKMPSAKISNFDMSKPILDHFNSHKDGSWILKCREWANPMSTARYNIIHDISVRKRFDAGKTVGIILGVDKPQVFIRDQKLYLHFVDTTANITPITEHIKTYDNSVVEFFYWSPDSADILCKQAHTILKYLKTNIHSQNIWNWATSTKDHPLYKQARTIKENLLRHIIYNTWNINWFQAEKGTVGWMNVNDNWFFNYFKETVEFQSWQNGIDYILNNISQDYIMLDENRFYPMYSRNYFIGNLSNSQ